MGPPDPLTNLRPVAYATPFAAPANKLQTRKLHPYSLEEFSNTNVDTLLSRGKREKALQRLEALRQRFEAQDLAWRLQRRRLDLISHKHWARSNTLFRQQKQAAEELATERAALAGIQGGSSQVRLDPTVMDEFHRQWVDTRANDHAKYHKEWIKGVLGQIRPGMWAQYRLWRWRLELWRCGMA